jgi:hypothetical protein
MRSAKRLNCNDDCSVRVRCERFTMLTQSSSATQKKSCCSRAQIGTLANTLIGIASASIQAYRKCQLHEEIWRIRRFTDTTVEVYHQTAP